MRATKRRGSLDPLIAPVRRHADVRQDHVRPLGFDGGEERCEVAAGCRHLDLSLSLEHGTDTLAHEVVVFSEHHTDRQRDKG